MRKPINISSEGARHRQSLGFTKVLRNQKKILPVQQPSQKERFNRGEVVEGEAELLQRGRATAASSSSCSSSECCHLKRKSALLLVKVQPSQVPQLTRGAGNLTRFNLTWASLSWVSSSRAESRLATKPANNAGCNAERSLWERSRHLRRLVAVA